uniref:Protein phosphatase n=1 Tax=Megaselia scalaris TaxID=36166 RepID=T1H5W3_MEGSC
VADGVGGWRNYGIDPGEFSSFLMKTCERLVHCVNFNPQRPVNLLSYSYCELLEQKKPILGSSTACVLILNRENSTVYTANIGDSGFMVVRQGEIVHKSEEQQHYFNTPFQLSLPPPGHGRNVLSDSPESADTLSFPVKEGDVIMVATDGVFDNVPESLLLDVLKEAEGVTDPVKLQMTANSLALMARSLSFDSEFMS